MALTYTIAGLQAELDAFQTAFKARDWDTALDELMDYELTYHGLFASGSQDGVSIKLPEPKDLREAFERGRETALSLGDDRRILVGRTNYGAPGG